VSDLNINGVSLATGASFIAMEKGYAKKYSYRTVWDIRIWNKFSIR
jgi:hypothetical protein